VLISQSFVKFRLFFRVTYFMPTVVSLVAVGIVWSWMYNPNFGIINKVLSRISVFGAENLDWLGNENLVIWALLIAGSWTYYGFCMVIFIAALQGIDSCYLEVATIEGATFKQKFVYVIIPLLKNTVTLLVLNSLIGSFKVFDIIMIMTKGGPYHSSEVIATYMFTSAFSLNEYGYGASLAIVLTIIIAVCSAIYMKYAEKD
jgi:raffinose/stachyose/melibiose transport system permease protein